MKHRNRLFLLLLCCALLVSALPVTTYAVSITGFPDVEPGIWYEQYLNRIMEAQRAVGQMNIISGLYAKDGTLVFEPNREVKRGEWLKMLFEATEASGNQTALVEGTAKPGDHWAKKYYDKAQADNVLMPDINSFLTDNDKLGDSQQNLSQNVQALFSGSKADLEKPITRYEMAVILNNVCTNIAMQKQVIVSNPQAHITDYAATPTAYALAVEQSYGKGLLVGDENGAFNGNDTLTRAQAATVLYRYLFQDTIRGEGLQDWAEYPQAEEKSTYLDPSLSFANWLRQGHIDAWGNLDAEARTRLFGNPNKTYFTSSKDAAGYMTTVSVPVWIMDKAGTKTASATSITVHTLVAEEVKSIFQMIFDDPEQFPIYGGWSAGGARFTDTMRHNWGCAIDINAYYNCECTINWNSMYNRVTCGYGWWPVGHSNSAFAGTMGGQSVYSIGSTPSEYGYSVVKAFATYGWGWGGQGYSRKSDGNQKFDFMHFSVLPSGG